MEYSVYYYVFDLDCFEEITIEEITIILFFWEHQKRNSNLIVLR